MRVVKSGTSDFDQAFRFLLDRRQQIIDLLSPEVENAISRYRNERERALIDWAREYDGVELEAKDLWVDEDMIKSAHKVVSSEVRRAIDHAKERIERFQEELKLPSFQSSEEAGVFWGTEIRPLERVGVYVPGGRANYFLTLLLCAVPARIAGVNEIIVASPPKKKLGPPYVDPTLLYLAKLLSISKILVSGGIGAMTALAFGTEKTRGVEKLVGSGGVRAAVAKLKLAGYLGVEGLSGPSETAFLCDKTTSVAKVAADIIGKADHDPDAELFIFNSNVKWMETLIQAIAQNVEALKNHQDRQSIETCLEKRTTLFVTKNFKEAINCVNQIAPGVVCLAVDNPNEYVSEIHACGSLLLGHYTPPVGLDLVGGPSGLVGTLGSAAFSVSMSPASFVRRFTVMEFDKSALERFQQESVFLSKEEGFPTREASFKSRLTE
jgi:histidinol dehydrogenase